ncbi:hypothetical protein [Sphingobacterium sp.]|uniref:hypothetical protein n=1 Tax=Sphingobacterium sp. TaxID=341027 RepID=UPI00289B15B5|nr:hypothetical protein [Sphingobacterium sp.]
MIKFKKNKNSCVTKTLLILLSLGLGISSCKQDENTVPVSEDTAVKVNMLGIEAEAPTSLKLGSTRGRIKSPDAQTTIIALDNHLFLEATLTPESVISVPSLNASSSKKAAAIQEIGSMDPDKKYIVNVYEAGTGTFVKQQEYKVGSEQGNDIKGLTVGKTYDFVVVSYNDKVKVPLLSSSTAVRLNDEYLYNIDGNEDFMYYKTNLTISNSKTNNLNVTLKHKFSQVTTKFDASALGSIQAVSASFDTHNTAADCKLSDGTIVAYKNPSFASLQFLTTNLPSITATPTIITSAATANATLNIHSITIDRIGGTRETRSDLKITGLNITPGVRYNLNLTFTNGIRMGNVLWATGNLAYSADKGYYFDDPSHVGDTYSATNYWQISADIPDLGKKPTYSPYIDACSKMGNGWRLPSLAEYTALGTPNGGVAGDVGTGYIYFNGPNGEKLNFYNGGWRKNKGTDHLHNQLGEYIPSDAQANNYNSAVFDNTSSVQNGFASSKGKHNDDDRMLIRCVKTL